MKNTAKLFVAAFVVAIAASCGAKSENAGSAENVDTTATETVAPAPVEADTTETVSADTTAVQ